MTDARRLDKTAMRRRGRELRALLNQWDPIGVMGPDTPPGDTEYDDLLWPLLRLLEKGASAGDLAEFLQRKLNDDYGLTPGPAAISQVAKRIKHWHDSAWAHTV